MSPNHAARLLIMSAYLYYRCDTNVIDDGEYDKLSLAVANNWDKLDPQLSYFIYLVTIYCEYYCN